MKYYNMKKMKLKKILIGDFTLKRMICSLIFIYLSLMLFAYFYSEKLIFQNQFCHSYDEKSLPGLIMIPIGNGEHISAKYYEVPGARYTVLFSHGNATDISDNICFAENFNRLGLSAFLYDYRGYGLSSGTPSEKKACEDAEAAYRYLVDKLGIPPDKIISYGQSLGGAMAVDIASKNKVGGLVLKSTFETAFKVMVPFPIFPVDRFRNIRKIRKVTAPVLIVHGTEDEVIAFRHSEKLFSTANEPKTFLRLEKAGHDDSEFSFDEFEKSFIKFIDSIEKRH